MKEVLYPDLSQVRLEVGVVKLADVSSSFGLNDNKSSHIADKMRLSLHSYQKYHTLADKSVCYRSHPCSEPPCRSSESGEVGRNDNLG